MPIGPVRDLGPAIVEWGSDALSEIFGDVRWTLVGERRQVFEALYGATPVDQVFLGYSECKIIVPATRMLLALLNTLLPGGTIDASSTVVSAVMAGTGAAVGRSMYENGLPLFVKPIVDGVAAANGKWLRLERTYPVPNYDVVFNLEDQRVYGIEFDACPDATSKKLWEAGDVNEATSY